jgi:hypothetical protein
MRERLDDLENKYEEPPQLVSSTADTSSLVPGQKIKRPVWMPPNVWYALMSQRTGIPAGDSFSTEYRKLRPQARRVVRKSPGIEDEDFQDAQLPEVQPVHDTNEKSGARRADTVLANEAASGGPAQAITQLLQGLAAGGIAKQAMEPHRINHHAQQAQKPVGKQVKAGNYKKGHIRVGGMAISIENPAGSTRSGVSPDGKAWSTTMRHHYGYIRGSRGYDKDHVDVFVNPDSPDTGKVFVVNQRKKDGSFDEHKCMIGFSSITVAKDAYLSNYSPGWKGCGSIVEMPTLAFRRWALSKGPRKGKLTKRDAMHGLDKQAMEKEAYFPLLAAVPTALKAALGLYFGYQSLKGMAEGAGQVYEGIQEKDWKKGTAGALRTAVGAAFAIPSLGPGVRSLMGIKGAYNTAKATNLAAKGLDKGFLKSLRSGQVSPGVQAQGASGAFKHRIMGGNVDQAHLNTGDANLIRTLSDVGATRRLVNNERLAAKAGIPVADWLKKTPAERAALLGSKGIARTDRSNLLVKDWKEEEHIRELGIRHGKQLTPEQIQRLAAHGQFGKTQFADAAANNAKMYDIANKATLGMGKPFYNASNWPQEYLSKKLGGLGTVAGMGAMFVPDYVADKLHPEGSMSARMAREQEAAAQQQSEEV